VRRPASPRPGANGRVGRGPWLRSARHRWAI